MGLLVETADWFKDRRTPIKRWFRDDQGRYAFRVEPDGQALYCCAVSQTHDGGEVSVMRKLIQRAIDNDVSLLVRHRDEFLVFDPVAFVQYDRPETIRDDRKKRGEEWLTCPKDWGVDFQSFMDGYAEPRKRYRDLRDFKAGSDA
jgi:hypothetical protein